MSPNQPAKNKEPYFFRLDKQLKADAQAKASDEGTDLSTVLIKLLEDWVKKP